MQPESIVDDTLKDVQRFRILIVGRSGVGKSSLINRVLGLNGSPNAALVERYKPGYAEIDREFTSPENKDFILHDSEGFEPGNVEAYNNVDRFIRERSNSTYLEDQLYAVWLCTETPRAGGRIVERGDENLLRLADETGTPVVIVFTKYDRLVRLKRDELQEDEYDLSEDALHEKSNAEAQKALDVCIQSLESTLSGMQIPKLQTPKPRYVTVSDKPGYEDSISSLVQVTRNLISPSDKLKLMWAITQRASRQVKINASVEYTLTIPSESSTDYSRAPSVQPMSLHAYLERVHQDIVTCWNFKDEEKTLSSDEFKQLMLYLVQDVQDSQNQDGPHVTSPLAIGKISAFISLITAPSSRTASAMDVIGLTFSFTDWLSRPVLGNEPLIQRLLMAYVADLITVLTSLFDVVEPSSSEETVWSQLNRVFQAYERLDPREQIHPRICAAFQRGQQTGDPVSIGLELRELLSEREPPVSGSERNKIGGRNAQDTGAGVSAKSPGEPVPSSGVPSSSLGGPAQRRTRPLVWYRLFPRHPLPLSIPKSP